MLKLNSLWLILVLLSACQSSNTKETRALETLNRLELEKKSSARQSLPQTSQKNETQDQILAAAVENRNDLKKVQELAKKTISKATQENQGELSPALQLAIPAPLLKRALPPQDNQVLTKNQTTVADNQNKNLSIEKVEPLLTETPPEDRPLAERPPRKNKTKAELFPFYPTHDLTQAQAMTYHEALKEIFLDSVYNSNNFELRKIKSQKGETLEDISNSLYGTKKRSAEIYILNADRLSDWKSIPNNTLLEVIIKNK